MHIEMQQFVVALLQQQLPANCYYHDVAHTLYVQEQAIKIGRYQQCAEAEMRLLHAAALWHDTGYIHTHEGHEAQSCLLAQQHLPGFGFSAEAIETVCGMIQATKVPQQPTTPLQAIIADADLEYLGTPAVYQQADLLFKELQSFDSALTPDAWNRQQVQFLQSHRYFTDYCLLHNEPAKQDYLRQLTGATV